MIEQLGNAENVPFVAALGVMLALAVLQVVGLGDMLGGDADVDADMDVDSGLLSLIGLGKLPFLMWLMLLLAIFGLVGLAGQQFIEAMIGHPLDWLLASVGSGVVSLPLTGVLARPLAAILPQDETTAIDITALVGREGEIVIGTARPGSPARTRVTDFHGQDHYLMVEPDNAGEQFAQGDRVLLVRREGDLFKAISRGDAKLPRLD
jgi:hypothetical protein